MNTWRFPRHTQPDYKSACWTDGQRRGRSANDISLPQRQRQKSLGRCGGTGGSGLYILRLAATEIGRSKSTRAPSILPLGCLRMMMVLVLMSPWMVPASL